MNQTITTDVPVSGKSDQEITSILHEVCDKNTCSQFVQFLSDLNIGLNGDYTFTCNIVSGANIKSLEITNIREAGETYEESCKRYDISPITGEAIGESEETYQISDTEQTYEESCKQHGRSPITGETIGDQIYFTTRKCACSPGNKHNWYMIGDPKKYLHREGEGRGWYKCYNCEKWGNDYSMINHILYGSLK